jgi:hypothetical protein
MSPGLARAPDLGAQTPRPAQGAQPSATRLLLTGTQVSGAAVPHPNDVVLVEMDVEAKSGARKTFSHVGPTPGFV